MAIMLRPKTVLQRIVDELLTRIRAMRDDDDTSDLWNHVLYGPVSSVSSTYYPAIGLEQGNEETIDEMFPYVTKRVTFFLEFRFRMTSDIESAEVFRYYLGRLQSLLFTDQQDSFSLGGLSINVQETGSNPEIENATDASPGGVLIFYVDYRHKKGDPYRSMQET